MAQKSAQFMEMGGKLYVDAVSELRPHISFREPRHT